MANETAPQLLERLLKQHNLIITINPLAARQFKDGGIMIDLPQVVVAYKSEGKEPTVEQIREEEATEATA